MNQFCNYCRVRTESVDGDCVKCKLSKPPMTELELKNDYINDTKACLLSFHTQNEGFKRHWASAGWQKCHEHGTTFGTGGNWKTERCPYCWTEELLGAER